MADTVSRMNEPRINIPEWTVSELSAALRRTVEDTYGHVRVRGEISGYRGRHSSGHAYFALKDEGARIDAVVWKTAFGRMRIRPEEGLEVIATGRLTTYPGRSSYQIVIESLEPAGLGALMALLEQRKRRLAAEGLFDEARKQRLPYLPAVIGVVTSPTGAVIRDILHRLAERFPRHVMVWPVRVQGDGAAEEIAAAIRGFNALGGDGPIPRPDLLIVARGGGSIEDLWSFNEEIVVRAAADSVIPLISAVGHETDVQWPSYSEWMDYELELACVISKTGKDIAKDKAMEHVFGFTIFNDFSARDAQMAEMAAQLGPVPQLHARVEGVHVHVQDGAARVVGRRRGRGPGGSVNDSRLCAAGWRCRPRQLQLEAPPHRSAAGAQRNQHQCQRHERHERSNEVEQAITPRCPRLSLACQRQRLQRQYRQHARHQI